jgi:DNA-binding MarR family transcriptional regulator
MAQLNPVIHQPVRLRIMASLVALEAEPRIDFSTLGKLLQLTDGNLGAHLQTLEEAGYIKIQKKFVRRKPRTDISVTGKGRYEFAEHVAALKQILTVPAIQTVGEGFVIPRRRGDFGPAGT